MNNNFWFGCVESRNDDLKLGRYRVRVSGLHTDDKSILPTDDLPWATCLQPTTSAATSGIGQNPGLVNGSWVMVVFTSNDYQVPIILGSIAGIPGKPNEEYDLDEIQAPPAAEATPSEKVAGIEAGVYKPEILSAGQPYLGTLTLAQYNQYCAKVRMIESSNQYDNTKNPLGYIGAYQFGAQALETNGYIKAGSWARLGSNKKIFDDTSNWTGKDGATSKQAFLASVSAQDKAMLLYTQWDYKMMLRRNQIGPNTDPRVLAGLLGATHNQGHSVVAPLLRGVTTKDGNGTTAQSYYDRCYAAITVEQGQQTNTTPSPIPENPKPIPNEDVLSPPKTPKVISKKDGFADPEGKYPTVYDEPDTNRLVRGQNISKTIVGIKEKSRTKGIRVGLSELSWDQPSIQYAAKYPYNHANVSESGHVFEMDDTVNAERVHLYHRAGSFIEIDQAGNQVNKIFGHGIEIIERDGYISIKGNCHINVDGACTINATSLFIEAAKINIESEDVKWKTKNFEMKVEEKFVIESDKDITLSAKEEFYANSTGGMHINSSSSKVDISASQDVIVNGSKIQLNSVASSLGTPGKYADIKKFSGEIMNISSVSFSDAEAASLDQHPIVSVIAADEIAAGPPDIPHRPIVPDVVPPPPPPINTSECPIFDLTLGNNIQVSPNFKLRDLCDSPIKAVHGLSLQQLICNLSHLANNVLEPLRVVYGKSLKINSCWRYKNTSSQHERGEAVDIGFTDVVWKTAAERKTQYFERAKKIVGMVPYDQFLFETRSDHQVWIHISYTKNKNRKQVLTLLNDKTVDRDKIVLHT